MAKTIRIGGASGYWGESMMATPQLLKAGNVDYLVYDFLAEITMSIMARARANKPEICLLYTSPSPRDMRRSRMPSSA